MSNHSQNLAHPPPLSSQSPQDYPDDLGNGMGLFGHRGGNSTRRQSISRVILPSYTASDGNIDDDNGIYAVDPLTHQTTVVRPDGSHTSKEMLDKIDKISPNAHHDHDKGNSSHSNKNYNNHQNSKNVIVDPHNSVSLNQRPSNGSSTGPTNNNDLTTNLGTFRSTRIQSPQSSQLHSIFDDVNVTTPINGPSSTPVSPVPSSALSPAPTNNGTSSATTATGSTSTPAEDPVDVNIDATNLPVMNVTTTNNTQSSSSNTDKSKTDLNFNDIYLNNAARQRATQMDRGIVENHMNIDEITRANGTITSVLGIKATIPPTPSSVGIPQSSAVSGRINDELREDDSPSPSISIDLGDFNEAMQSTIVADSSTFPADRTKRVGIIGDAVQINHLNVNTYEHDPFNTMLDNQNGLPSGNAIPISTIVTTTTTTETGEHNAEQEFENKTYILNTNKILLEQASSNNLNENPTMIATHKNTMKQIQFRQLLGDRNHLSLNHPFFSMFIPNIYPLYNNVMKTTISQVKTTKTTTSLKINQPTVLTEGHVQKKHPWKGTTSRASYQAKRIQVLRFALNRGDNTPSTTEAVGFSMNTPSTSGNSTSGNAPGTYNENTGQNDELDDSHDPYSIYDDDEYLLTFNNNNPDGTGNNNPKAPQLQDYDSPYLFHTYNNTIMSLPTADPVVSAQPTVLSPITIQHNSKLLSAKSPGSATLTSPTTSPTTMNDYEYMVQQRQARRQLARTVVPPPQEVILNDENTIVVPHPKDSKKEKKDKKDKKDAPAPDLNPEEEVAEQPQLPLPYGASGYTTLAYITKSLESKQTKDLIKPRVVSFGPTTTNSSNPNSPSNASASAANTTPFNPNIAGEPAPCNTLRPIIVHKFNQFEQESQLKHLTKIENFEKLCRIRMRQGCLVYKYKHYHPTRRVIYLSHNDTQITWRELTTKEEKRFDLYESLNEFDKELLILHDLWQYMVENGIENKNFAVYYQNFLHFYNNYLHNQGSVTHASTAVPLSPTPVVNNYNSTGGPNVNTQEISTLNQSTQQSSGTKQPNYTTGDNHQQQQAGAQQGSINAQFNANYVTVNTLPQHLANNSHANLTTTNFTNSGSGALFKSTKSVPVDDISSYYYGPFVGAGFVSFVDQCKAGKAKPWYATTISVNKETLNLVFLSSYDVTLWLQGLNALAPSVGKAFSYGKMLWLRTIMKINFIGYYEFIGQRQLQNAQQQQQHQHLMSNHEHELPPGGDAAVSANTVLPLLDWSEKLIQPGSFDLRGVQPKSQYYQQHIDGTAMLPPNTLKDPKDKEANTNSKRK